ncbi:MAG: sodium:solute symporter [Bacteroidales bacterium]|nr:sodium:solute symporter [Bacteroidales bacterium]MBR4479007.1 sodium:solute symporter [Bacteroidales bacterium]
MLLKCILLILFFAVMIGVGIYCRRTASDVQGFVLGGRNVGSWLTAFAFGTSYFSAVIFVGYAGQFGWKYGLAATWIGIGNALIGSLLAWRILGRRTRLMTQHLQSATMPDFFGKRFFSDALKVAASVIVFVFLIPYTASLYNGLSRLFSMAFNVDYVWCVLGMAILTGIYVLVGGYMATAVNDFIQGLIMLVGICAVIGSVLAGNGGFTGAVQSLSQIPSEAAPGLNGAFVSFLGPQPIYLLGVVLLTSLGTWGLPQMVGKFYAIRNEAAIRKGTFISTFFAIIVAGGCYFLGGFGRLYGQSIEYTAAGTPVYDSIVPSMLASLPDLMIGVVIILVLSASMSTLSSLVLTSGSTLTLDIIDPAVAKMRSSSRRLGERNKLLFIRLLVLFFIIVSSVIAIVQAKSSVTFIAQLMGISWGALAGAFLAPFLYGLYWKRTTPAAVWVSFISGVAVMCGCMYCTFTGKTFISPYFTSPINAGVLAMLLGLVIVPVVSLLTKVNRKEEVEEMFGCYNSTVSVRAADSLVDETEQTD